MIQAKIKIDLGNLKYLRKSANNVAIRKAINTAGVPVKAAVVAAVPKQYGNLAKSIRIRSKFFKKSSVWCLIVGPSSTFTRIRKKPKTSQAKKKKPNKTLAKLKKKAGNLKRAALKRAGKTVRNLAGRRQTLRSRTGRKLADALRNASKKPPKQKLSKPKKRLRRKRKWNGKAVRPAYYSSIVQFGSVKLSARRFLERALSASRGRFATLLCSSLKREFAALMRK